MATQNAIGRLDKTQSIAFTSSPVSSAAIGPQTYKIRLTATTACTFSIGAAVAVLLPALVSEYFVATPGQLITGITQVSAAGSLNIVEIA